MVARQDLNIIIKIISKEMSDQNLNLEPEFFNNTQPPDLHFLSIPEVPNDHRNLQKPLEANPHIRSGDKFYQEFRRIYSVSHHLRSQKQRLGLIIADLMDRIATVESRINNGDTKGNQKVVVEVKNELTSDDNRGKRSRRTAEQIQKKFKCQAVYCERFYGSQGSLQQHIKLKHPKQLKLDSSDEYRPNGHDKFQDSQE